MDLNKIFMNTDKTLLNNKYLTKLEEDAKILNDELNKSNQVVDSFYRYGKRTLSDSNNRLVYNEKGNPVHGSPEMLGLNNRNSDKNYKNKIINRMKEYIDSAVAQLSEVNPLPQAVGKSNYEYEPEIKHKMNLVLENIFNDENDFKVLYQLILTESYNYRYELVGLKVDTYNANTTTPIKMFILDQKKLLVEPKAKSLDEAEYLIYLKCMTFDELEQNYSFKPLKGERKDPEEEIELKCWWIRFQPKEDELGSKWLKIYQYNKQRIYKLDEEGNAITESNMYVEEINPFVLFRAEITKYWYGDVSKGEQAVPLQDQYNDAITQDDLAWEKLVDPPAYGNANPKKYKEANKPGGFCVTMPDEEIRPMPVPTVDMNTTQVRQGVIKELFSTIFGNTEIMQGERQKGVYSNAMLETLISMNQVKPKMIENRFLDSVAKLAEKSIFMLAEWMGSRKIKVYDPEKQDFVGITANELQDAFFKIDVKIADANLLTPQAKLDNLTKFMQYGKLQENLDPYHLLMIANNAMADFIPKDMMDQIKIAYDAKILQMNTPNLPVTPGAQGAGAPPVPPASTPGGLEPALQEANALKDELMQTGEYQEMNQQTGTESFIDDIIQAYEGLDDPNGMLEEIQLTVDKLRDVLQKNRR